MTIDKNNADEKVFIGNAAMLDDGTIVLDMFAQEDGVAKGTTRLTYPPDHKNYKEILKHIGEIKPREKVGVFPWPDERVGSCWRIQQLYDRGSSACTSEFTKTFKEMRLIVSCVVINSNNWRQIHFCSTYATDLKDYCYTPFHHVYTNVLPRSIDLTLLLNCWKDL